MNITANITDFFKLPIKIIGALAFASAMILFLPDTIIKKIYMESFRKEYGFTIGIVFIVTFSILLVSLIIFLQKYFSNKYYKKRFEENAPKRLKSLTMYQKAILYHLYLQDNYTDELPINDGAVLTMEHNLMIQKTTTQYFVEDMRNPIFPYMLQPWVVDKLNADKALVSEFDLSYSHFSNKLKLD